MRVLAGGLIRDRVPQLRVYLRHLQTLRTGDVAVDWWFILDNCVPETVALVEGSFGRVGYTKVVDGGPAYVRETGQRHYDRMARLRNYLRDRALGGGYDALLSIDSDIVIVPRLLEALLAADRPWVAAVVDNSRGARAAYNVMFERDVPGHFGRRPLDLVNGGPAAMVGAVCLYRRSLLERAEYLDDPRGEDVGFARSAAEARVGGWYVPLELEHLMTDGQLRAHLEGCPMCGGSAGGPGSTAGGPISTTEEGTRDGVYEPGTRPGADPVRAVGR